METHDDAEAVKQFAREHHMHYELEPETVDDGTRRRVIGFEVHFFAAHESSQLGAPACPRCRELATELRSLVEHLVHAQPELAARAEVAPAPPALYQSREVPGADEVSVTVRVRCASEDHRRPEHGGDPCIAQLRERLDAAGVPRR
jgi:hypothetical protein